jgi:hypothetical protein
VFALGHLHKAHPLVVGDVEAQRQSLGHLHGRSPLVGLDLLDRRHRATHTGSQRLLRQVARAALPPHPLAER